MNIDTVAKEWEDQYRYGSPEERINRARHWLPYYDLIAGAQMNLSYDVSEEADDFVLKLAAEDILTEGSDVLDIGCGMGSYTLPIAARVGSVTAMDVCDAALKVMMKRTAENGLDNVTALNISWEEYVPDRVYDTVISSMCPAICNVEELLRMEAASRGYCVLITVIKGSYDKHRKAMMQELELAPEGMVTEFSIYEKVLKALGREYLTETMSYQHEYTTSLESLLRTMPVYFGIFGIDEARSREFINDYFKRNQEDGVLHDESRMNLGMIYWRAKKG